jgi:hypothetical protein
MPTRDENIDVTMGDVGKDGDHDDENSNSGR